MPGFVRLEYRPPGNAIEVFIHAEPKLVAPAIAANPDPNGSRTPQITLDRPAGRCEAAAVVSGERTLKTKTVLRSDDLRTGEAAHDGIVDRLPPGRFESDRAH